MSEHALELTINGRKHRGSCESRMSLGDYNLVVTVFSDTTKAIREVANDAEHILQESGAQVAREGGVSSRLARIGVARGSTCVQLCRAAGQPH